MWTLIIIGTFLGTQHPPGPSMDGVQLNMTVQMQGEMTITMKGFTTEKACKAQLPRINQLGIAGVILTIKASECKDERPKS